MSGLTEADRGALGLALGDRLRVVEQTAERIVIERTSTGPMAPRGLPALSADLAVLPLAPLLGAIHEARSSGLLCHTSERHEKQVYLHRGEVVFATSTQRVDRLGECLMRAGVLTLEQLREAERRFQPPARFGKVLVECGFLTPRELWNGVKYQVEEVVRSLFAAPTGRVCFWEGECQPDNVVRLSLETRRLVSEGLQRSEELRKFLAVLDDSRVRLARVDGFSDSLAGSERAIADAIGASRSFPEVCGALVQDRESVARSIQLLRLVGAVRLMRLPEAATVLEEGDVRSSEESDVRARVTALAKLIGELRNVVASADGTPAVDERLARVLDDVTGRFPALLTGLGLGQGGGLDPEAIITRALKLPGDREDQAATALGELVAYLEFEIKNHPAISKPDELLAGYEALRRSACGG